MDGLILEPLRFYNEKARDEHKQKLEEHFDKLLSDSGVNVAENRRTVAEYDSVTAEVERLEKKIKRLKVLIGFLIAFSIIGIISFIAGVYLINKESEINFLIPLTVGIIAAPLGFVIAFAVVKPHVKRYEKERNEANVKRTQIYNTALTQTAPLNALFDDSVTLDLIEEVLPDIKFDRTYTNEREEELIRDYDYIDYTDSQSSVIDTLSGTLFENPFLFERYLSFEMGTHTYHGTRTISWTESYVDSKGKRQTRSRTQTLHAYVTKPKPMYFTSTHLGYGAQAAPDLVFSRTESDTDELSERALKRRIKAGEKKLRKKSMDATSSGESFQEMSNSEFDVLFGAHNRNHEVQFRLMFTPLAQNNTVDLLRSKDGYGDDFNFIKQGRFNVIRSVHSQKWDMNLSTRRYMTHSVDLSRERFISFNTEYFKSVFFDLAPLMAIPAYHEGPVPSMQKPRTYAGYYPPYEHEALANRIGECVFQPEGAKTRSILKTRVIEKRDEVDRVQVTASSFDTIDRTDYVYVRGGDGRSHAVPVHWLEYIPISKTSEMLIKRLGYSERELFNRARGSYPSYYAYLHGLMAYHPTENDGWEQINKFFEKYK